MQANANTMKQIRSHFIDHLGCWGKFDRFPDNCGCESIGLWLDGLGEYDPNSMSSICEALETHSAGLVGGADVLVNPCLLVGIGGGYHIQTFIGNPPMAEAKSAEAMLDCIPYSKPAV